MKIVAAAIAGVFLALAGSLTNPAYADPNQCGDDDDFESTCSTTGDGGQVTLTQVETQDLNFAPPLETKLPPPPPKGYYRYWDGPMCPGTEPRPNTWEGCNAFLVSCNNVKGATGRATYIWAALVPPGQPEKENSHTSWMRIGSTCWPDDIPVRTGLKGPSLRSLIKKEFRKVPFTAPTINVQPPDHKALVTKPEYVHITFDGAGNGPGEVYTATLLGHTVTITPKLEDITYDWGDGTKTGPTSDRGGKYPDGKITHAYDKHGTYTITTTATYSAVFSIDGATSEPTTQTATRTSSTTVTVVESYNDLVKD